MKELKELGAKEDLTNLLNRYKGILTFPMVEYLNSLIELEFSVVRNYISKEDRKALSELEIYKKIALYNIFHRALSLFKSNPDDILISVKEYISEYYIYANRALIFSFGHFSGIDSDTYKNSNIGDIRLFQVKELNDSEREKEIDKIKMELEKISENKVLSIDSSHLDVLSCHLFEKKMLRLRKLKDILEKLNGKVELSCKDKEVLELFNQFSDFLMNDYGLTDNDFDKKIDVQDSVEGIEKQLIKTIPSLRVIKEVKYII